MAQASDFTLFQKDYHTYKPDVICVQYDPMKYLHSFRGFMHQCAPEMMQTVSQS